MRWWPIALADVAVLVAAWPAPALADDVAHPADWLARVGTDRAIATLAGTALWCVAVWVALSLLACLLAAVPGAAGRFCDRVARLLLPAALYRIAASAAGLGVVLAPAVASASPATAAAAASVSSVAPSPTWPSDRPLPAPLWPTMQPTTRTTTEPTAPAAATRDHAAGARPDTAVVRPGDSLWSIAAAHLPPDAGPNRVAREWPRWYGANRAVIGDDPALIHPGQVLVAPAGPSGQEDRP